MNVEIFTETTQASLVTSLETFFAAHTTFKFLDIEYTYFIDKNDHYFSALIIYQE